MKQILSLALLLVCLSANAQDVITTEKAENTIQNELTLGLNGGSSLPVGLYASKSGSNYDGNAEAGSTYGLDVAMNFNGSRFGWLSTAFISNHTCTMVNSNSGGNFASERYYNGGILLGATYAFPLKNRSALTFSAQLGYILTTVPGYSSYVEIRDQSTPIYNKINTEVDGNSSGGFLFDLGASYRLHFPKTNFYLLGKLNYQSANTNIFRRGTVITTTDYANGVLIQKFNTFYNNYTHAYSVVNMQVGCGFFLN